MSPRDRARGLGRRDLLRATGIAVASAGVAALEGCSLLSPRTALRTVGEVPFATPLPIPPLATSTSHEGARVFELVARSGRSRIVPQGETDTWGLNGPLLGPTLRARRGETVRIDVRNELSETTTLHWHGMRLPAAADGGPHQPVAPGGTWSPTWTVDQPAATLWYHPHPHGETERHVYRGLGGMFLIDDDEEAALDLPRTYGVDDIPVIVQDKTFDDRGGLVETDRSDIGMLGDTVLVNGAAGPVLEVTAQRTRLRLLNASTARTYAFGLSDGRPFDLIASDGGLLAEPASLARLLLTPGERAEIVVTMDAGESVALRSFAHDLGLRERDAVLAGAHDELDVLLLRAAAALRPSAPVPLALAEPPRIDLAESAGTRAFSLGNNRINGQRMDMSRIDAEVVAGTVETWFVTNAHSQPHNFHIHDVQFVVAEIDGAAPPPELSGWKDTVYIPPGSAVRLGMRFGSHTDPHVPYMFHCHLLWHEDQGMMGQFLVVEG
ncbi:multicopper oxidase family protein [Microbacterium sp. No. 7]|uniref:multicopper oxidase family protein n=1 Tax=Microbacterium sp. No. 7 TaxID=1714373 RepID=UPI0006ED1CF9|nr:multicopper oxidase domain-containing protein [Microbacterium sp. No. 7]ALJ20846.1 copper oxidase [Microbacterium sp. No. 7]